MIEEVDESGQHHVVRPADRLRQRSRPFLNQAKREETFANEGDQPEQQSCTGEVRLYIPFCGKCRRDPFSFRTRPLFFPREPPLLYPSE